MLKWEDKYEELRQWIEENGKIPSFASKNKDEKSLGSWCSMQRRDKKMNKLSQNKIYKLQQLNNWYWNKFDNSSNLSEDKKYYCSVCNYQARDSFNYNKHLSTKRHKKIINGELKTKKILTENGKIKNIKYYECEKEGCKYKGTYDRGNFRKHKLKHEMKKI